MGRTIEQLTAANELSTAAQGYRVIADAEGWPITPGKYGRLENLGTAIPGQPGQLAAFTDSTRIFSRALALAGVSRHQTGDDEYRVLLARKAVPAVAKLLRCHRRRNKPVNGFKPRLGCTSQAQETRELAEVTT